MLANLTEELIANLQPSAKPEDVRDTNLTGFMVRVGIGGTKTYYVEPIRGRRFKIGKVSDKGLTLKLARLKAHEIIAAAKSGKLDKVSDVKTDLTLEEFLVNVYYPYSKNNMKHPNKNMKLIRYAFRKFLSYKMNKISPLELERWKTDCIENGNTSTTINRNLGAFKACLNRAVELNFLSENPIRITKRLKTNTKPKTRYLSKEEKEKVYSILNEYPKYFQVMVQLSLHTGLRKGELVTLKRKSIKFDIPTAEGEKISYIEIESIRSKNGDFDMVSLNESAKRALLEWFAHPDYIPDSEWVFTNPQTKSYYRDAKKPWDRLRKQLGLKDENNFRWHDMRHDFASQLAMKGVPMHIIKEAMRHKTVQMTDRYMHLSPLTTLNAVRQLD